MKNIVVTAATGNIGRKLVTKLTAQGHHVTAITRSREKAAGLFPANVLIAEGAMDDVTFLAKTFAGADAVFALIPPEYTAANFRGRQNIVGDAIARAIQTSGVKKVVNLSSLGAELEEGVGPIKGLHDQEQRLGKIQGLDLTHLRAAYFYENTFFGAGLVSGQGIFGTAVRPEAVFAHVATDDIATIAAGLLTAPVSEGIRVVEAVSENQSTMKEITETISHVINKPVQYVAFPYDATKDALVGSGLSPDVADQFVELYDAMNRGLIKARSAKKENHNATNFRDFMISSKEIFMGQ